MRLSLILLSILFVWADCHALTLSDIRTEIRTEINDNPTDTGRRTYTDAVLLKYINEAQKEIVNLTWLCERATSYALTGQTTYYALPTDLIAVHQVYFRDSAGSLTELDEKSQKGLYDTLPDWEKDSGQPLYYWVSSSSNPASQASAPSFISYIPILPRTSTGTATVWYYNQPADLSSDSHTPFENRRNLYSYHLALAYHSISRIKQLEGRREESQDYNARYEKAILILKDRLGRMPNYFGGLGVAPK